MLGKGKWVNGSTFPVPPWRSSAAAPGGGGAGQAAAWRSVLCWHEAPHSAGGAVQRRRVWGNNTLSDLLLAEFVFLALPYEQCKKMHLAVPGKCEYIHASLWNYRLLELGLVVLKVCFLPC